MSQVRVLFVCLGNICRSPLAEGVFLQRVKSRGLADRFEVDSCGTGAWHVGEPPDPRTAAVLKKHGAPVPVAARQLARSDFSDFDFLLAMDRSNLTNMRRQCPPGLADKLHLVLATTSGGEVPDPYYGGPDGFDEAYDLLSDALDLWIERMVQ